MNLVYYSLPAFKIRPKHVTVIDTAVPRIYQDILQGIRGLTDEVRLSDDDFKSLTVNKNIAWYGDPLLTIDLNRLFQRKLQAAVLQALTAERTVQLTDKLRELCGMILMDSDLMDVPLDMPESPEIDKLIKFSGLQLDASIQDNPYDILETLIKVQIELGDQRTLVVTNVSHYLDAGQIKALAELIETTDLALVIIEFSLLNRNTFFQGCDYSYVDSDFVVW